ncbi:putative uncharacterized protein [Coprobacillus sp. CAG:183]|nr:putative uncharacterized protein [Coprobacillus sp. CAG:183]
MKSFDRMKELRKKLKMSQEEFGQRIGLTKASVSRIESNLSPLTERNAKAICREFNVDYSWLTEGTGEMFIEFPDVAIDMIVDDYKLDETDRILIETYLNASADERKYLKSFLQTFAKNLENKKRENKD